MRILIGADIVPTDTNQSVFAAGQMQQIVSADLLALLAGADYRVFNLETPLTDTAAPIAKCGRNLMAPTASVAGIKQLGVDFVTLANNHILDQGEQGLRSTTAALEAAGIAYAGVGHTLEEAARAHIVELGGKKVGFYCCVEHEFSVAEENKSGANPFDPLESLDHIAALKAQCDAVICLYHGGREHYPYPLPYMQKICRKIVEKGADVVICQHTHCIGCREEYQGAVIIYGQGNFLFDRDKAVCWNTALLVELVLEDSLQVEYHPLERANRGVRLAQGESREAILQGFEARSAEIRQPGFVQQNLQKTAKAFSGNYMRKIRGNTTVDKVLYKLCPPLFRKLYYTRKARLQMINGITCEPHREMVLAMLHDDK